MALDVKLLLRRIRGYAKVADFTNLGVSTEEVEGYVNAGVQWLAFECGIGQTRTPALIVLAPNTDTYAVTVPGGKSQFGYVADLTLRSQGWPLVKRAPEFIRNLRVNPPGAETFGDPTDYSLVKLTSGVEQLDVWPRPNKADSLDGVSSEIPNQINLNTDMAAVLPFGISGFEALGLYCGALAIDAMSPETAKALRVDKNSVGSKMQQAQSLANTEASLIAVQSLQDDIDRGDA